MANFLAAITGNDLKEGATSTYIFSVHTCVGKKKEKKNYQISVKISVGAYEEVLYEKKKTKCL